MAIEEISKALGDETRRRIIEILAEGEKPATEIFNQFPYAAPTISRHLSVLKESGLVSTRREGVFIFYNLEKGKLQELNNWLKDFLPKEKPRVKPQSSSPRPPKKNPNPDSIFSQFGSDL